MSCQTNLIPYRHALITEHDLQINIAAKLKYLLILSPYPESCIIATATKGVQQITKFNVIRDSLEANLLSIWKKSKALSKVFFLTEFRNIETYYKDFRM